MATSCLYRRVGMEKITDSGIGDCAVWLLALYTNERGITYVADTHKAEKRETVVPHNPDGAGSSSTRQPLHGHPATSHPHYSCYVLVAAPIKGELAGTRFTSARNAIKSDPPRPNAMR